MFSEQAAGVGISSGSSPARTLRAPLGTPIAASCLAAILLPGLVAGGSARSALLVFVFLFAWVWLPGSALARWLEREDDALTAAAKGLVLGSVLLGLVVLACRATGQFVALQLWPLASLALWALPRTRSTDAAPARAPAAGAWLFAFALLVVLLRMHTGRAGPDLMFHGGNAAELMRSGPLLDPRVAGHPLNYHLLAHTLPAAARLVTQLSIAELFERWLLGFHPLLLALLVFVTARELTRSAAAGLVATLVLLLHHDLIHGFFGEEGKAGFLSHLNKGIFLSFPTCFGLALLAALALVLLRWTDSTRSTRSMQRADARALIQLALLAAGASLAKGSIMPVVIAGTLFAFLVQSARERRWHRRWLAALLVLTLAALPATLWLAFGPGSYAGAMFRVVPLASATTSGVGAWFLEHVPWPAFLPDGVRELLVAALWIPGFLGLSGIGALAWLVAGRPSLRGLGPWILGVSAAGLGAALLLLASGISQIYFGYDAHVVLALPSAVGALALARRRRAVALGLALLALPFAAAGCIDVVRSLRARIELAPFAPALDTRSGEREGARGVSFEARRAEMARLADVWLAGAAWLRENTEPEALLVAHNSLFVSFHTERRMALADERFAPEIHASRWTLVDGRWRAGEATEDPFAALREACQSLLERADGPSLAHVRALTGHAGTIYLVHGETKIEKNVAGSPSGRLAPAPNLESSPVLERCFENDAMAVYRARD